MVLIALSDPARLLEVEGVSLITSAPTTLRKLARTKDRLDYRFWRRHEEMRPQLQPDLDCKCKTRATIYIHIRGWQLTRPWRPTPHRSSSRCSSSHVVVGRTWTAGHVSPRHLALEFQSEVNWIGLSVVVLQHEPEVLHDDVCIVVSFKEPLEAVSARDARIVETGLLENHGHSLTSDYCRGVAKRPSSSPTSSPTLLRPRQAQWRQDRCLE